MFCQKVEKIGENEDYLKTNYIADREVKNKFSLEILKGKYYPENDSIILVLIYCKPPFFNNVTIYKGRFIDRKESIYLEGNVQCLNETLYLIFDYPYKYYTFKHFEV